MAEQAKNTAALDQLKLRQEILLNKITSLQSRVNDIQRERDIPYDTSKVKPTQFKQLRSEQESIFKRLLSVADQIESIAQKQNIQLPAQNEVVSIIQSMAKSLEKRQKRSLTQLKVLSTMANSLRPISIPNKSKQKLDKKEEEKVEIEDIIPVNKYKSRTYDLESVSDCLRTQCVRMDNNQYGEITTQQLNAILETISLIGIHGSINNTKHIQIIINQLSMDSIINYNKFLDLIIDTEATDKLSNSSQWNLFRYNLIGEGRNEGSLRILYRYDGWPEPLSFMIKEIDTNNKNSISLKELLSHIEVNAKDTVDFEELRYASNPTFMPGKRGWKPLDVGNIEKEKVSFLVNNDGTLEIDIWLRTKEFIVHKRGRPLPEEDDEDLIDID